MEDNNISLSNDQTIFLLKSIGNNLKLGRSVEKSLHISIKNLEIDSDLKSKWIKSLNLGSSYKEIFENFTIQSADKSISRVWVLLSKITEISTFESGEKILEIAENLEKNKQLVKKRDALLKAQKYKILFLGIMTSIFLGIISGLAPLFATFVVIFRNIEISETVLKFIPFSLYSISALSNYFVTDVGLGKFTVKSFLLSSIAYIIVYFITKAIMLAIM